MELSKIKDYVKDGFLILLTILCIILLLFSKCTADKNERLQNNIEVLIDSVRVTELKNGDLLYSKQILEVENKELTEAVGLEKSKRKEVEKELGEKIKLLAKVDGKIRVDTLILKDTVVETDFGNRINFNFKDQYLSLDGTTCLSNGIAHTKINSLSMDVPAFIGKTNNKQFFIRSENPYVSFPNIRVAEEITRPKKWGLGIQVGIGCGYNLVDKGFFAGPYILLWLSYNFLTI